MGRQILRGHGQGRRARERRLHQRADAQELGPAQEDVREDQDGRDVFVRRIHLHPLQVHHGGLPLQGLAEARQQDERPSLHQPGDRVEGGRRDHVRFQPRHQEGQRQRLEHGRPDRRFRRQDDFRRNHRRRRQRDRADERALGHRRIRAALHRRQQDHRGHHLRHHRVRRLLPRFEIRQDRRDRRRRDRQVRRQILRIQEDRMQEMPLQPSGRL